MRSNLNGAYGDLFKNTLFQSAFSNLYIIEYVFYLDRNIKYIV